MLNLRSQTFSAVRWSSVSSLGQAAFQLLQIAVLARLLPPQDFGLMAMAMVVIAAAQIVSDLGVHNAIIHSRNIGAAELSSLYWMGLLGGLATTMIVFAAGPLASLWFGEPALTALLAWLSPAFLIASSGKQLRVVAQKELRFDEIASVELGSALAGLCAAVAAALSGAGVYSLAAGAVTTASVGAALDWIVLSHGWRPQARLRMAEIRIFAGFGAYSMLASLANKLHVQADLLVGGRLLPAADLGLYSLPRNLCLQLQFLVSPIVSRVGFPVLAMTQEDAAQLKAIYLKMLRMMASVNFPAYVAVALFAEELVVLLFGENWGASVPLLQILAVWGLVRSVGNATGSLVFAVGRADLIFLWEASCLLLIPTIAWFGASAGVTGLAVSMLLAMLLIIVPSWLFMIKPLCGAGFHEFARQLLVPLGIALACGGAAWLMVRALETAPARLGAGLLLGTALYVGASRWLNRVWYQAMVELFRVRPHDAEGAADGP